MDAAASGKWVSLVTAAISTTALATLGFLGTASRYVADDFGFPIAIRRHGFWASQWIWYKTWSGRMGATFVSTALAAIGDWTPAIVPAVIVVAWLIAAVAAARALGASDWWTASAIAAAFVYACCDGAAQPYQSLLWQTGSVTYVVPLVLMTVMGVMVAADRERVWKDIAIVPIAAITATFSETMAVCTVVVAVAVIIFAPSLRRRAMYAAAGAMAGLLIVALAPGNAVRRAHFPRSAPLAAEIRWTLEVTAAYFVNFARRAGVQFLLLLAVSLLTTQRANGNGVRAAVVATVVAIIAALVMVYLPLHVGYGRPPARGLIVADYFVLAAAFFIGAAASGRVQREVRVIVMVAVAVPLIAGPCRAARYNLELAAGARRFAERWDAMDARLRASPGRDVIADMPATVGGLTFLGPDPRADINRTVAQYYGVRSIANARRPSE